MAGLRFLLVGAELSNNRGTASIALSAINEIRRVFGSPEIAFLSYVPKADKRFESTLAIRVPEKESSIKIFAQTILVVAERCLGIRLFRGDCRKNIYRDSDVMIHLGGDGFSDDRGAIASILSWLPFFWCMNLKVPTVIFSHSIGPYHNRIALRVARFFLDRVDLLLVREGITRDYLAKIGVKRKVFLTADGAFLLGATSESDAEKILEQEGVVRERGRPLLCVAPSELMMKFSRARTGPEAGRYENSIAQVVDYMIDKHDVDVIFVPHVVDSSMDIDDKGAAIAIAGKSRYPDRTTVIRGDYRPEELRGVVGLCALFIGSRMHASIAALAMHVPTVAVSYSIKTPGIMSMAGLGDYVVHWNDPPECLLQKAEDAWANRSRIRMDLQKRIPEIQLLARRNAELVSEQIVRRTQSEADSPR